MQSLDYAYFADWRKYPTTLFMTNRLDVSDELVHRIDERFNFHEHQIAQVGSALFTYAMDDPISVTKFTNPTSEALM